MAFVGRVGSKHFGDNAADVTRLGIPAVVIFDFEFVTHVVPSPVVTFKLFHSNSYIQTVTFRLLQTDLTLADGFEISLGEYQSGKIMEMFLATLPSDYAARELTANPTYE